MLHAALVLLALAPQSAPQAAPQASPQSAPQAAPPAQPGKPAPIDWRAAEPPVLRNHVQLTFPERFLKAGESYFNADASQIVFQAIERPAEGVEPADFYAMFVADVVRSPEGRVTGLANIKRLSPEGSANTCGWFHPTKPGVVVFGSTVTPPSNKEVPGYQRGTGRYRWQFPPEMRIVQVDARTADGTAASLKPLVGDGKGYVAEGSLSSDGRTLLYTQMNPETEGDLWVLDLPTGKATPIVQAKGYDGGPFFTPDGTRIIFRSDRRGNSELQVFTADLVRDAEGRVVSATNERAMTDNAHVNWCPFFHPDGAHFAYSTSEVGHSNYEVFLRDARDPSRLARITNANGADVLPVFSPDGKLMMWTAQRGPEKSSQIWVADFSLEAARGALAPDPNAPGKTAAPKNTP